MKKYPEGLLEWTRGLESLAASFVALLGLAVMVAWYAESDLVLRVRDHFVPMHFNVALCFFLSGVGLIAIIRNAHVHLILCLSCGVALISLLTLCEYIYDVNLGIDQLFYRHPSSSTVLNPGRMAPNSAVGFFLTGAALFIMTAPRLVNELRLRLYVLGVFASIVFGMGAFSFFGYFGKVITVFSMNHITTMAIHTSLGFIALSVGLITYGLRETRLHEEKDRRWLTAVIGIGITTLVLCLWRVALAEKRITELDSSLPWIILCGGLLMAGLLAWLVFLAQTARIHARDLEDRNKEIQYSNYILRETQKQLSQMAVVVKQSSEAITIQDLEGKIHVWNHGAERIFGWSEKEALTMNIRDLLVQSEHKETLELWNQLIEKGEIAEAEIECNTKGGERRVLMFSSLILKNDDGIPHALALIGRDITERRKAKMKLEDRERELETSLKRLKETQAMLVQAGKLTAIGQLGAGIAHELNQPIAAIMGFAQLMLAQVDKENPLVPNLKLIEQQSQRMARIIDNIRTFSRDNKGERIALDINRSIHDSLLLLTSQLKRHGIEVKLKLDEFLPEICADPNQMQQIFINLFSNAQDAIEETGRDGTVIISSERDEKGFVVIRFRDSGIGIPKEIKERIFDPFYTTKAPGKGTGLGLSILHGIIENHDGHIYVNPEVEEGTEFVICLPPHGEKKISVDLEDDRETKVG